MKLVGKAYCWRKVRHIDYRCWFVLKDLLHALYAPYLLYSSEEDYKEPTVVDEPEPAAEPESEPTIVDEPEPELEIEEPLAEISADLPAELDMELVSSTPAVRVPLSLRSLDVYDPLQIFLKVTDSQFGFLMIQNTIGPIFIMNDLSRHAACFFFEVPSTTVSWSRKPVSPPPP